MAGVALYAFPGPVGAHWPWLLTPIAAQTIAVWLIVLSILPGSAAAEGDAFRCRPASAGMTVLAILDSPGPARPRSAPSSYAYPPL